MTNEEHEEKIIEENERLTEGKLNQCMADKPLGDRYKKLKIQPRDFIYANEMRFEEANILKYICRWRDETADGIRDLKKAKDYIEYLIEFNK